MSNEASSAMTENVLEQTCLHWLEELGWQTMYGPSIAPGTSGAERESYSEVILEGRLRSALSRINSDIPAAGIDDAVKKILTPRTPDLLRNNRDFHAMLTTGITVEIARSHSAHGDHSHQPVYKKVWLLDINDIENNDWLVVNQLTVVEKSAAGKAEVKRRADVVLYVNGLPMVVLELKNPGNANATVEHAFNQLQTYKKDIPVLFASNELLLISDGIVARSGTLTSGRDRYMPWRTVAGEHVHKKGSSELETLVRGLFERRRFLDYILNFIVFEDDGSRLTKIAAGYHQYWAVNKAVNCTLSACGIYSDPNMLIGRFSERQNPWGQGTGVGENPYGTGPRHFAGRRIGVVWHTQGSGKSLSMMFYAGKVVRHPSMDNPTMVIITDRNDLDDQLFGTFASCSDLLRQSPVQAKSRHDLRERLKVASGGVIFTTIQKFMPDEKNTSHPLLSDRKNIVVIADEAHRSQYDFIDGFARHLHDALPNASFIGFTGTPIENSDKSTPAVFGDYIDKYDIQRAVEDGATVPIHYESRLARIELNELRVPTIDPDFEYITEDEEESQKEKLKTKWAALEAMVGAENRIRLLAEDISAHFEKRLNVMEGKALIVCMSRRICVDVYNALTKIRPEWHSENDSEGFIKIVMSGSISDNSEWQQHIRSKSARERIAQRFKDPDDCLKLVIVRDMWLTGFDCPSMHTMYIDKPVNGHNLMQAIARVNRVFRDKPGGLVVDYIGLADSLKKAFADYTGGGGTGLPVFDVEQAVIVLMEKYEVLCDIMHGFDYRSIIKGASTQRMSGITRAMEFILELEDGKNRYLVAVSALSKAFALTVPHEQALKIRDEIGFFQEVRAILLKATGNKHGKTPNELDFAIKQLVSESVSSAGVVDIFEAAGVDKPDISILSDEFLEEIKSIPQKNLAMEMLKKLINDDIKIRAKKNVVQARSFAEMLKQAVKKYQNRTIEAAEVIQELIALAREMRASEQRGDSLGLNDDEIAFYDALADNGSARKIIGDEKLRTIAQLLVDRVKKKVSIDWALRENVRAQIRVMVKRILREYGYPPDLESAASDLVIEQAEVLCKEWGVE